MPRKRIEEKVDISEDAIGVVSIRKGGKSNSITLYFDKACTEEIGGRELQFNKKNLSIRVTEYSGGGNTPTIYGDNCVLFVGRIWEEFEGYGYYEMVCEKDKYQLYKIEE